MRKVVGLTAFAVLLVAYLFSQFFRSFLAVVADGLSRDLGLGPAALGDLSAVWFAAFALAQFPIGHALDRHGPRATVTLFMVAAVMGAGLLAAAPNYPVAVVAMAAIGIGCAPILMGSLYVFGRSEAPERFALLSTMMIGLGSLGNLLAATPLTLAVEVFGWRGALGAVALGTAVSTGLVWLMLRDPPPLAARAGGRSPFGEILALARMRPLWPILPIVTVSYAVLIAERSLWIGPFLAGVYQLDSLAVGNAALAMAVAMTVGSLVYGPVERWVGSPKRVVLTGSAVTAALFLTLGFFPAMPVGAAIGSLTLIGACGATYGLLMAHGRSFFSNHLLGRGVTFLNFLFLGGAGIVQILSGRHIEQAAKSGADIATAYGRLHLAFGAALLASVVIYRFSREDPDAEGG